MLLPDIQNHFLKIFFSFPLQILLSKHGIKGEKNVEEERRGVAFPFVAVIPDMFSI